MFRRRSDTSVKFPFRLESIISLSMVFHIAIEEALRLRMKPAVSFEEIWESRFFRSYVAGYPASLDDAENGLLGAVVREHIMRASFSHSKKECISLFKLISAEFEAGNQLVRESYMLGDDDGQRCFAHLIDDTPIDSKVTYNLKLAVRGLDSFN